MVRWLCCRAREVGSWLIPPEDGNTNSRPLALDIPRQRLAGLAIMNAPLCIPNFIHSYRTPKTEHRRHRRRISTSTFLAVGSDSAQI